MGRKGGIKSGESRRKKKKLQQELRLWLQTFDELEKKNPEKAKQLLDVLKRIK